ncbi:MAG: hypothetical protein NTZ09_08555 [Candidatus Hydrogenedentes bacterium]|nr:hypothetical protein [Candidatus Hydrogenedentota bacterium]
MYRGIVLTGTQGSGKMTIARVLMQCGNFMLVPAVTTRQRRDDDVQGEYSYLTRDEFDELAKSDELLTKVTYGGFSYGIRKQDVEQISENSVPILIVSPESARHLTASFELKSGYEHDNKYMTVFLDAPDGYLGERLGARGAPTLLQSEREERRTDREQQEQQEHAIYSLRNVDVDDTANLILALWDLSSRGGVLSGRLIRLMLKCGMLLDGADLEQVSGASYDLCLGDEYFKGGRLCSLAENNPILQVAPYDYAIVTSREGSVFPRDICARFDLSNSLFCQGLILSNGPQVDPGFRGPLFCLLFNTSSSPVMLKRGQHYATLEFHRLIEPTALYAGKYRGKRLIDYLPANASRGAINELKKELEQVRKEATSLQNVLWLLLTVLLAIIALFVAR